MAVAANAEEYAASRLNIFFPAHNNTPADGNLTGQCVTLNKWFLAEMTAVPSPFAARGDARYVGQTLVNQGHATKVPYEQRRRGDFAVFEYGTYGHIGVLLDQDRIFEQNVNVGGVARKLVDGSYVYASRVGRLSESWRPVRATIYRINSYTEGSMNPNKGDVDNILGELWGRKPNPEDYGYTNQNWHDFIYGAMAAYPYQNRKADYADAVEKRKQLVAVLGIAETRSANLQRVCDALGVVRQPDEQATSQAIIDKYNEAVKAKLIVEGKTKELEGQVTDLQRQLDELQNGDNIVITKAGWAGLFDVIKQFFAKKK